MNGTDIHLTDTYFTVAHYHLFPIALVGLALAAIVILPYWKIFDKAGFPRVLGILMIVPLVNLVLLYIVAFSQWKVIPARNQSQ